MSRKKDDVGGTEPTQSFDDVIKEVAEGVKALTAAGMSGPTAGDLAFKVWCATNSVPCPAAPPTE